MSRRIHLIMPMAGEGTRFIRDGIKVPKPMIEVEGRPLYERAIASLSDIINEADADIALTFLVRQQHIYDYEIDRALLDAYPSAIVIPVEKTTRGAAETVMIAAPIIRDDDIVIIMDCDFEFVSRDFIHCINMMANNDKAYLDGMLLSFDSTDPRYSYADINEGSIVLSTAEKNPISNHALAGVYVFGSGRFLKDAYATYLNDFIAGRCTVSELYVSELYNYLISAGHRFILLTKADEYHSFGTPDEIRHYLYD